MDFTEENITELVQRNSPLYDEDFAAMYSEIENEITDWSMEDNRKTAGWLTRKIIMIVHKNMNNV